MCLYKSLIPLRVCVCVCWVLRMRPVFTVLLTAFLSSNCNELHELALERKKVVAAVAATAAAAAARNTLLAKNLASQRYCWLFFIFFYAIPRRRLEGGSWPALVVRKTSRVCRCLTVLASATATTATATATSTSVGPGPRLIIYKNLFGPQYTNTIEL